MRDSIAAYDLLWQRAEFFRERYIDWQNKGLDLVQKIVTAKEFIPRYRLAHRSRTEILNYDSLTLRINTEYMNHFLNFLADQKISTAQDKEGYKVMAESATRLIELIRKEYRLK